MSEVDRFWQRLWEKSHASFLPMIALEGPFGLGLIYKTQSGINVAVNDLSLCLVIRTAMHFHLSHKIGLLFHEWRGKTLTDHLFFAVAVFIVSVVYEFLKVYLRYQSSLHKKQDKRYTITGLFASFLYQINFTIGYGLMLIIMTHSVYLFTAVLLGSGVGYFIARPAYKLMTEQANSKVYYVKQTKAKNCSELETERLDTSFCSPDQFTYV